MQPRILIVDSHNAQITDATVNLHARNALVLARHWGADLAACEADLRPLEGKTYDVVIFNHASAYFDTTAFVNFLKPMTNARFFYITNEYNLGEAWPLWALCRDYGFKFEVIANHEAKASKVVEKNVTHWTTLNLNALIYTPQEPPAPVARLFDTSGDVVYYGAFREDRLPYFRKYFDKRLTVSTSLKNKVTFQREGLDANFVDRLLWSGPDKRLFDFRASLYIEDTSTHANYNYLANRFYEALSHRRMVLFDLSCRGTVAKSGYPVGMNWFIDGPDELHARAAGELPKGFNACQQYAHNERQGVLWALDAIVGVTP